MGKSQSQNWGIRFTDLLYGAVISFAVVKIELNLALSNLMLMFSLLIVFNDWIDYHITVNSLEFDRRRYFAMYVLDILVLVVWDLSVKAIELGIGVYLIVLSAFFFLTWMWDLAIAGVKFWRSRGFPLSIFYAVLGLIYQLYRIDVPALALAFAAFVIVYSGMWKNYLS